MVFLPVMILLFGLGDLSKILLITLVVFFQILVATKEGERSGPKYIDSMRSMGATEGTSSGSSYPAALPSCFTALRIITGTSISVLYFAETFAGTSGLGYMITNAWTWGNYTEIYVGILAMSILGIAIYEAFTWMERRMCRWTRAAEEEPGGGWSWEKAVSYAQMIKLSHTVFALPFGLAALVILSTDHTITAEMVLWIIVAIVGARSAAMGFNRIVDAGIDSRNPHQRAAHTTGNPFSKAGRVVHPPLGGRLCRSRGHTLPLCFVLSFPVLAVSSGTPTPSASRRPAILCSHLHRANAPGGQRGGGRDDNQCHGRPQPCSHHLHSRVRHTVRLPGYRVRPQGGP